MNWMDLSEYGYKNGYAAGRLEGAKEIISDLIEYVTKETGEAEDLTQSSQDFYWGEAHALGKILDYANTKLDELTNKTNKVEA